MAYRMNYGYPVVDAVYFDGDGFGHGVRSLLIDRSPRGPVEEGDSLLTKSGETELAGWGRCDGPCVRLDRDGVGYYAVPAEQWTKVEACLAA